MKLIEDPHFRVVPDLDGSSPCPEKSIWSGQHQCVSECFTYDDNSPSPEKCGDAIIRHQLTGDRGHYSVLRFGYLVLGCDGFPHSVVSQITRHQDSAFLVQSGRYTGERFIKVANGELPVEQVFYFRPLGYYTDRKGKRYGYSELDKSEDKHNCFNACVRYAKKIEQGYSEEHARDCIPYNFRHSFVLAGDLRAFFHWLDQRTKADSQLEIQTLAAMCFDAAYPLAPRLMEWYKQNRYGRARLAP